MSNNSEKKSSSKERRSDNPPRHPVGAEFPFLSRHGDTAIRLLLAEREYQKAMWTHEHDDRHTTDEWAIILSVYMGKVSSESKAYKTRVDKEKFKSRVSQLGAVCLAALESLDRASG